MTPSKLCPGCGKRHRSAAQAQACRFSHTPQMAKDSAEKQAAYAARRRRIRERFEAGSQTPWEDPAP